MQVYDDRIQAESEWNCFVIGGKTRHNKTSSILTLLGFGHHKLA
jgi:hypothetical protein